MQVLRCGLNAPGRQRARRSNLVPEAGMAWPGVEPGEEFILIANNSNRGYKQECSELPGVERSLLS